MNRRNFIKSTAALPLVATFPVLAQVSSDTFEQITYKNIDVFIRWALESWAFKKGDIKKIEVWLPPVAFGILEEAYATGWSQQYQQHNWDQIQEFPDPWRSGMQKVSVHSYTKGGPVIVATKEFNFVEDMTFNE